MKKLAAPVIVMLLASSALSAGQDADDARRKDISAKGTALFKNTGITATPFATWRRLPREKPMSLCNLSKT